MGFSYLFWDLDGTLTDPGIGITNSVMYALEKFGIKAPDRSELYPFIGPPLMESFKKYYGFDEETAKLGVTYYREYFGVKGLFENEVYAGIPEFLDQCTRKGIKHVLATSKPEHYAVQIMEHFGLGKYFHCMCGSRLDAGYETKADVIRDAFERCGIEDKSEVLMIGDRMHDICGAKECGIACTAVLWGYGSREEFLQYGADHIVEDLDGLWKVVAAYNGI
ncbi:MAG: HAD hydrolase-like protein [Alistipes sp.]|nr:HAD hydrolase-like protein [Alistipes sp.]